jgi:hypothetical protein
VAVGHVAADGLKGWLLPVVLVSHGSAHHGPGDAPWRRWRWRRPSHICIRCFPVCWAAAAYTAVGILLASIGALGLANVTTIVVFFRAMRRWTIAAVFAPYFYLWARPGFGWIVDNSIVLARWWGLARCWCIAMA